MYSTLDNNIVSMLYFLILIIVLWLCKRIHLSGQIHAKVLRKKGDVSNLLSNGSSNIYVYMHIYIHSTHKHIYIERRETETEKQKDTEKERKSKCGKKLIGEFK